MSAPVPLNSGCCAPPCPTSPQSAVPGPAGEDAFSLTTANFTQPAVSGNVTISVTHDGWVVPGQVVFVQGGGYYTVVSVSGLTVTITNTGNTGNAAPGTVIASGAKVSPGGIGGNVGNAFTTTAANYTQPAVGAQVNVKVVTSAWAAVGQRVFVATGGYYTIFSIPDATHLNLTNDGDPVNAAPGVVINFPQQVSPAGLRGPTGATGTSTLNLLSPTTTKGDLIVDNGANAPLASDVRFGVGTDGKALVADSTQPTGLAYATITPNTAVTDGDIAVFNGTAGTPMALKDSKLLITSDGAIQSTPSGGNARGTKAVDLQVSRVLATQVASGNLSGVLCGQNNTASAADTVVAGGTTNVASALCAAVAGGQNNTASAANAAIAGGNTNVASGQNSCCLGGFDNTASATDSAVAGGEANVASGQDSFVGGGIGNTASGTGASALGSFNVVSGQVAASLGGQGGKFDKFGQVGHASVQFVNAGDAQASELIWRRQTADAVQTEIFLDGDTASQRATVPLNSSWIFHAHVIARSSAGVCAAFEIKGAIQNNANTVTLVAALTTTVVADGTGGSWGVAGAVVVDADNTNKTLRIRVTGAALTAIAWVAHARLVEVAYG